MFSSRDSRHRRSLDIRAGEQCTYCSYAQLTKTRVINALRLSRCKQLAEIKLLFTTRADCLCTANDACVTRTLSTAKHQTKFTHTSSLTHTHAVFLPAGRQSVSAIACTIKNARARYSRRWRRVIAAIARANARLYIASKHITDTGRPAYARRGRMCV